MGLCQPYVILMGLVSSEVWKSEGWGACAQVAKVVAPRQAALKEAEAAFQVVSERLQQKQAELKVNTSMDTC